MNIVGFDIGYSNLKLAYGNSENGMQTAIRPAGAAPADRFGSRIDGKEQDDFLHVLVGNEPSLPVFLQTVRKCVSARCILNTLAHHPIKPFSMLAPFGHHRGGCFGDGFARGPIQG